VREGATRAGTKALQKQLNQPRFRFLNQVPAAKEALLEAIKGVDVKLP
jgi:hypothetical protein